MEEVLVMKLVLIALLVSNAVPNYGFSSMQLNYPRLQGNETDKLALLAIKAQIQHDPNQVTRSWNESLHFCQWKGVTCSQRHRQRVTMLELGNLELVGSISPHIGNLSFLKVLNLFNNSFTRHIPPQIGHLHRLQVLLLNMNSLTGTIPSNISNCFRLTRLHLGNNSLVDDIPINLSSLSNLKDLNLGSNNLTGEIPPSLGNLSSLEILFISKNNLQGSIHNSLCRLRKLTVFALELNRFSGIIPSCVYNLSGIYKFGISGNQFQGSLPPNMSNGFPKLQIFNIFENQFTGAIPLSLSNAKSLVKFQCDLNKLTGRVPNLQNLHNLERFTVPDNNLGSGKQGDLSFVSELVNATRLTVLDFVGNIFGGMLPVSISNLSTNLQILGTGENPLHGSIPAGLGNLVSLQQLGMMGSSFTGSIPNNIGKVSGLRALFLNNNKFSGSIPSSLGNLTLLSHLQLQENNLEGSIPSSLEKCHEIEELGLAGNNLNSTIPPEIFGLSSLTTILDISRNQLTGSLPMEMKLTHLSQLDISNNLLSGEIPSSLGSCQSLEFLYFQGNFFLGAIPSSLKELKGLQRVDFSRNNLSGDIPQFFKDFGALETLNLSFNQLWGAVPTAGIFKNASAASVTGNTRLCGGIASFHLPACKSKTEGGKLSNRMRLTISLVSGFSLLGVAVGLSFLFVCTSKKTEIDTSGNSFLQISYAALLKATDGFSSANLIGTGAFGSVYKGIIVESGVIIAVKVFNLLHRGASKSFISECEALRNIRHRNLVRILTACSSIDFNGNEFKALVYDFMGNGSLEDWLHPFTGNQEVSEAPKRLSLVQRLGIAIDVASALDYLHNHCETQIVHCDLKPSNVLLDSNLTGHVSDFGLSKFLWDSANVSGNQSSSIGIRGSVGYVAPEYGMGSEVSTYGDVYSFGILLLEMFTGKRPTDRMFSDSMNLHNYVKTNLPECVSESVVIQEDTTNVVESHMQIRAQKIKECLTLVLGIGIACSVESPTNRKDISDVVSELQSIRHNLLV